MASNLEDDVVFAQPTSVEERAEIAGACMLRLQLAMPTLLDDIENTTDTAYAAVPERLYVIDRNGVVTHRAEPGPFGFDVDAWQSAIEAVIDAAVAPAAGA